MNRNIFFTLVLLVGLTALVGCATPLSPISSAPPVFAAPQFGALTDLESAFENIYSQSSPSVVALEVMQNQQQITPGGSNSSRTPPGAVLHGLGSGFVWDVQGNIVTNNHVVDGADQISVTFSDGTTVPGKIVGADPDSDLAVIKVDVPLTQLHPVQMTDSRQVKVGQLAIAIGSPFGEQNTMTTGTISALGRSLPTENNGAATTPNYTIPDVIQTDAPINPGNSGGVLLNTKGQVIGVTFALESPDGTSSGIGFAIPSTIVQKVVPALIASGHYSHTYLGVSGMTLTPGIAQAMELKADQRGALIVDTTPNGPAAKAGLRASAETKMVDGVQSPVGGDIVTAINNQSVKSFNDLILYLTYSTEVNQTVTLTVLRDGTEQIVKVTIEARPN